MKSRAGKAKCFNCGAPATASVKQQKPSRKVGKLDAAIYKFRPICDRAACWQAYWDETV